MAPIVQFTKERILDEAFEILRTGGMDEISARTIAKRLGSSTQPVYSAYRSMADLKADLLEKAYAYAMEFLVQNAGEGEEAFLGIGMQYLRFARAEKELFTLLFISGTRGVNPEDPFACPPLIDRMRADRHIGTLDEATLNRLLENMWIYTHGLATLSCAASNDTDESVLRERLREMGGLLMGYELTGRKSFWPVELNDTEINDETDSSQWKPER